MLRCATCLLYCVHYSSSMYVIADAVVALGAVAAVAGQPIRLGAWYAYDHVMPRLYSALIAALMSTRGVDLQIA